MVSVVCDGWGAEQKECCLPLGKAAWEQIWQRGWRHERKTEKQGGQGEFPDLQGQTWTCPIQDPQLNLSGAWHGEILQPGTEQNKNGVIPNGFLFGVNVDSLLLSYDCQRLKYMHLNWLVTPSPTSAHEYVRWSDSVRSPDGTSSFESGPLFYVFMCRMFVK